MSKTNQSGWASFAEGLALAIIILAIGACTWMEKQNGPLIIIRHETTK